jgi:predicted DNA-binding protein (MmcQ/YjbR family)
MSIESDIFKRYVPDWKICKKEYEKIFLNNSFKAVVKISKTGEVSGTVYDLENNDEFLPLRIENNEGSFASKVKNEYEKFLIDIRNNYFTKNYFIYPQSNRITQLIIEKYGNYPEFLWEKFDGSGIFRNEDSQKWYAGILDVEGSKIKKGKSGIIEVLDIKLDSAEIQELLLQPEFYPAYHMNKKSWITIILDESLSDKKIMELVHKSYLLSFKNKKIRCSS